MTGMTRLAAISALVAAAIVALPAAPHAYPAPTLQRPAIGLARHPHPRGLLDGRVTASTATSSNWAGYYKLGTYTAATATWTVPTLSTRYDGYSSSWVGIDGASNNYLTQTGTEQDVVGGKAYYDAWYEVVTPNGSSSESVFSSLTIRPGDVMVGAITISGGSSTMTLTDTTTGKSDSSTSAYSGPGASVDWIQEDSTVNGQISNAPDWGTVNFSDLTANGSSPALSYATDTLDIVSSSGIGETQTSQPNSTGNAFSVKWLATGIIGAGGAGSGNTGASGSSTGLLGSY